MIQIDIEMPERCIDCPCLSEDEIESWCAIPGTPYSLLSKERYEKKPDWCPLKQAKEDINEGI